MPPDAHGDSIIPNLTEPAPNVQVDFTLAIGSGRLEATVEVPSGEVTLTQILPALQTLTSNIVASAVRIVEGEGHRISCQLGCGACCRQLVPLSLFEAEFLATWIRSLPEPQQAELARRFDSVLRALVPTGIFDRLDPTSWSVERPDVLQVAIDYLALKVPCPFLQDEACSIHPIRPLICREYLVTSPPIFCDAPTPETVTGVPMPIKPSNALFRLSAESTHTRQGWIPLVFLFAWMKSGAQPGNAVAGPGPTVLYEFVRHLALSATS